MPVASHTKTGWSTATEALEKIENAHPIVPLVIRWRLLRRMRDSWIVALRKCIDTDGRVHSRFHPARSFNGHLVNTNPVTARSVIVQTGGYAEDECESVKVGDSEHPVKSRDFRVNLSPGCGAKLLIKTKRYAHKPTFTFPWDR